MKNTTYIFTLVLLIAACGRISELDKKKKELADLRSKSVELNQQITDMEKEIGQLDPTYGKQGNNAVLVTAIDVQPVFFEHKIEVRGEVQSRTNVSVSAEVPGKIERVEVTEGDYVKRGQVLLFLNAEIIQNNIAELETNLDLATIFYQKRAKLWEKNIGTEIQYLQAKNNKESLERKLTTVKSQLKQTRVKAPFSGTVDAVDAKIGEMAQSGVMLFRIINRNDIHVTADVSERFIGRFKKGDRVEVYFPSQDKKVVSTIGSLGQVINVKNRTFEVEIKLPKLSFPVRPNQVVVLNMADYQNPEALLVPRKLIQKDNRGNFLYELVKTNGQMVAKKLHVTPGVSYDNQTEITQGLASGQIIAYQGYRELAEGVIVKLEDSAKPDNSDSTNSTNN